MLWLVQVVKLPWTTPAAVGRFGGLAERAVCAVTEPVACHMRCQLLLLLDYYMLLHGMVLLSGYRVATASWSMLRAGTFAAIEHSEYKRSGLIC